ncbi:BA14K family protein [Bradyrhizobium ganzhouense]|uniref:BA14K family protein n=1 Tax=Bradyrhizobium ganzhouense TaxID=1179767 RepID=UPI003CF1C1C6
MRRTIVTAPRDGKVVILEDDVFGTYDVARWSPESGEWIGENGEPIKITSSHWYPMQGDNDTPQSPDVPGSPSQAGSSTSRSRRSFFFPFFSRQPAPQRLQAAAIEAKRVPRVRWRFAAPSIAATLVGVALVGLNLRAEISAYVSRYIDQQNIVRIGAIGGQVIEQGMELPNQNLRTPDLLALQRQAEAGQTSAPAGAQVEHAAETPAPGARQSYEEEQHPEDLAHEAAEARRAVDGLNLQLQMQDTKTAQLLRQERERTTALAQEAAAARQELTASTAQYRHAIEGERARNAALAIELAMARREIETQVALLRKADDKAQPKQTAERVTAELRQPLQQERENLIKRQREQAVDGRPSALDEKPGVSLPAWANSYALVKPSQTANRPDVVPETGKPPMSLATVPLPRPRATSADVTYGCQRYRTYDSASRTYTDYDGRRRSCP